MVRYAEKISKLEASLKAFGEKKPFDEIEREIPYSKKAFVFGIPAAISFDVVKCGSCYGVVYELINADTLTNWLCKNPETLDEYAVKYGNLVKTFHETESDTAVFGSTKALYTKCPTSLALLTDLHNTDPVPILASLQTHRPSLIYITGDVLYGGRPEGDRSPLETQSNVLPFLAACAANAPTFLSLGNHEWMVDQEDLDLLRETGVTMLDNEWKTISVDGKEVILGSLTSGYVTDYRRFKETQTTELRYPRREDIAGIGGAVHARDHKPETEWISAYAAVNGYHILLSHHPEYFPLIPRSVELVLSGHAHGGQWRVFNHGVWAPGQGWWPKWTRGIYEGRLVVSAGLSNTTWIPRIWNPTEIVYLEP